MRSKSSAVSVKNREVSYNKPNEDFILADDDNQIYIVADGVTREVINNKYPDPSPAEAASKLFVSTAHTNLKTLLAALPPREALYKAAEIANNAIKEYNKNTFEYIDYFENNFAGAVAIAGVIVNDAFHYIYLGDCAGIVVHDNVIHQFTDSQTELIRDNKHKLGSGKEHKIFIRRDICNNPHHPYGYGVFTGAENALLFLRYGEILLKGNEKIILATDGLENVFKDHHETLFHVKNAAELIELAENFETTNPKVRSDDKSGIIISIIC